MLNPHDRKSNNKDGALVTSGIFLVGVVVVLVLLAGIWGYHGEKVRKQGQVHLAPHQFYRTTLFFMAPFTSWCTKRDAHQSGQNPFPSLANHFPKHTLLEQNWKKIRDEALGVYHGGQTKKIQGDLFFSKRIADDRWRRFYLRWYGPILPDARKACPILCSLLDQMPEVHLAMISILEPGARIQPHVGPFKAALRYHLGLQCPPEAWIRVDGQKYSWKEGEGVLFDDTFVHEVHNASPDTARVVLFCDVERQMSSPLAQTLNHLACKVIGPLTTRTNNQTEKRAKIFTSAATPSLPKQPARVSV